MIPFSLMKALSTFQRMMNIVPIVIALIHPVYLEEVAVFLHTIEKHIRKVRIVFEEFF